MASNELKLKQFRADGCMSYLLYDAHSGEGVVIDSKTDDFDEYVEYISEHRIRPLMALDTHTHADHYAASHLFRQKYGSEIGMGGQTASRRPTKKFNGGEVIRFGSFEIKVLKTPGHTPDSICFYTDSMIFTGDTLFISSSGRTDFPGADPEQQWESVHKTIGSLPSETLIYPGHEYSGILFSTLGIEKRRNPHWMPNDKARFVAMKRSEVIATSPEEIRQRVEYNCEASPGAVSAGGCGKTSCGAPIHSDQSLHEMSAEDYAKRLKLKSDKKTGFVDVREPEEYKAGHIPGTRNIPLSELGMHLKEFAALDEIYLNCQSGGRSTSATKTLTYLGLPKVVNVSGGFGTWRAKSLPAE